MMLLTLSLSFIPLLRKPLIVTFSLPHSSIYHGHVNVILLICLHCNLSYATNYESYTDHISSIIKQQPNTPTIIAFKQAMTLPGSRPDIIRTKNVPGPSPVGGSSGGTYDKFIQNLDEFEYQAAHYNLACSHACLDQTSEAVMNLKKAFEYGFDNFETVRVDPDLEGVRGSKEFERLMGEWDPKGGAFNPFGVFGR